MVGRSLFDCFHIFRRRIEAMALTLVVASAVFLACLFGIYTRPVGFLATVWPANAVMVGLLLRIPSTSNMAGWIACAAAFMAADLLTGSSLHKALILNAANLTGVAAVYFTCMGSPAALTGLRQPASMFHLLLAAAAGGAAAGIIGGIANPLLFNGGVIRGWTFWFATEFVNYVAILPVILSSPNWSILRKRIHSFRSFRANDLPPAVVLLLSFLCAVLIGGPGAIAFPVPALLWCGLVYQVFPTAILTLLFGIWTLIIISAGYVPTQTHDEMALISLRLGISLIAIAPITLACVMQSRNDLLAKLHYLATRDPLTGVCNRKAFRENAEKILGRIRKPCALLMIDLDHFKAVNDLFGHAAGDRALIVFSERLSACLRTEDLIGRLGGEEFAALVLDCLEHQVIALADRIRLATSAPLLLDDGRSVKLTASIGIAIGNPSESIRVDDILSSADAALYRAKHAGRDRWEI